MPPPVSGFIVRTRAERRARSARRWRRCGVSRPCGGAPPPCLPRRRRVLRHLLGQRARLARARGCRRASPWRSPRLVRCAAGATPPRVPARRAHLRGGGAARSPRGRSPRWRAARCPCFFSSSSRSAKSVSISSEICTELATQRWPTSELLQRHLELARVAVAIVRRLGQRAHHHRSPAPGHVRHRGGRLDGALERRLQRGQLRVPLERAHAR